MGGISTVRRSRMARRAVRWAIPWIASTRRWRYPSASSTILLKNDRSLNAETLIRYWRASIVSHFYPMKRAVLSGATSAAIKPPASYTSMRASKPIASRNEDTRILISTSNSSGASACSSSADSP